MVSIKRNMTKNCLRFSESYVYARWVHLLVGVLLVSVAIVWGVQYDVWNSTKLDLFGLTVVGKAALLPNREVAEYSCEFKTATEQIIQGRRFSRFPPSTFIYLRDNPQVFKVKGSGRGAQGIVVILSILALWQVMAAALFTRKKQEKWL